MNLDIKKWEAEVKYLEQFKALCAEQNELSKSRDLKLDPNLYVHFSCIGRWNRKVGCDCILGRSFTIHKLEIIDEAGKPYPSFEFADDPNTEKKGENNGTKHQKRCKN